MCNLINKLTIKERYTLIDLINNICAEATAMQDGISVRQVKARRAKIREKLGVRTNHELILMLFDKNGIRKNQLIDELQQNAFAQLAAANDGNYKRAA